MLGTYFYHEILRKTIIGFGTLFNNMEVRHETSDGTVVVADEISPDGCRLLAEGDKSMDKDLFRKGEGDIIQAYSSILESLKNNVK